jgi:HK97 family phage major capsid protein
VIRNKRLLALQEEDETLRARISVLDALTDDEVTDEQVEEYRSAVDRLTEIKPLLEAEMDFEEKVRSAMQRPEQREPVEGPDVVVRTKRDPFADLDGIRSGWVAPADIRARAKNAIEDLPDYIENDGRERATRLIEGHGVGRQRDADEIARHILLTGSPAYARAFQKILANPMVGAAILEADEAQALRAAMSLTDANGGYLTPYFLDPTIMLTNNGAINPLRDICTVKSITTDKWEGVTSAGVSAAYAAEAATAADQSPTFAHPTISPQRAHSWVFGSFEVIEDASFAGEIGGLFADAKARLEATKFTLGAGEASYEPDGVVTALVADTTPVTSAATDTFAVADVYALEAALAARFRPSGVFMAANAIVQKIRQFDTGGGSSLWAQLAEGVPSRLLGHPIYEASDMDAVINAAQENYVLAFFDPKQYVIVDRVGMRVMYEPMVKDAGNANRPTGQAGWYAFWRNSANLVNSTAGKILNVT